MAAITFTPAQERVITERDANLLVSAAAGSGKTAVLTERIVRMVTDEANPVDIDKLLVVTFTRAAAAEMKERIAAGIARVRETKPYSEQIERAAALVYHAQIATIDSFCLFLVRNHFHEIGLDPAFRQADEGEVKLLAKDVLAGLLEDKFAEASADFLACVAFFCPDGKESALEKAILELSKFASSFPWPHEALESWKDAYAARSVEEMLQSQAGQYLFKHVRGMLSHILDRYDQAIAISQMPKGASFATDLLKAEKQQFQRFFDIDDFETLREAINSFPFQRYPSEKKGEFDLAIKNLPKEIRDGIKDFVNKDLKKKIFQTSPNLWLAQAVACDGPLRTLLGLVQDFDARMLAEKQRRRIVDFNDVEHYALQILLRREDGVIVPSQVAKEYRSYFKEILIDEYQDSNLVQEYLLRAISGEDDGFFNRVMVGDIKQSIYKFRLARPELFLEKYTDPAYSTPGSGKCRIDLSQNFRSRKEVIDTVNGIFYKIMQKETGGIVYDAAAALYPGAKYPENPDCKTKLLLINEKPKGVSGARAAQEEGRTADASEEAIVGYKREAAVVAEEILELMQNLQVTDKESGMLRPLRFRDIAILLRSPSSMDECFVSALENRGIPAYAASKTGYFGAREIQTLLQILQTILNPTRDIPLFGTMKSVLGGFDEEEIARIRCFDKESSLPLIERLRLFAAAAEAQGSAEDAVEGTSVEEGAPCKKADVANTANVDVPLARKVAAFLQKLNAYRAQSAYTPIRALLEQIIADCNYLQYVAALPGGARRQSNVEMLLTKAGDYEKTSYSGLFHFLRYVDQLQKYEVDYGESSLVDENADVVRIMSIHKSKGLEFPVVFLCGMTKGFNFKDAQSALLRDMDLGVAVPFVDPVRRLKNKTWRHVALSVKCKESILAEELRLLYVALTRAKEKLIMTGISDKVFDLLAVRAMPGDRHFSYGDFMKAKNYMDFVLPFVENAWCDIRVVALKDESLKKGVQLDYAAKRAYLEEAAQRADADAVAALLATFARRYPYENLKNLYTKTSVSELKIAAMEEEDEAAFHLFEHKDAAAYVPFFAMEEAPEQAAVQSTGDAQTVGALQSSSTGEAPEQDAGEAAVQGTDDAQTVGALQSGSTGEAPEQAAEEAAVQGTGDARAVFGQISATDRGNAYHRAMELLDFSRLSAASSLAEIAAFFDEQVASLRLRADYRAALNLRKIQTFLRSPIAARMAACAARGDLYREQPFVLSLPASYLSADYPAHEKILIQGIIDAFFIEDDKIVLLDYKTDAVEDMAALWKRYETQMHYYTQALEKLMGKPVKEALLYSFKLNLAAGKEA